MPRKSAEALAAEVWRAQHMPPSPEAPGYLPEGAKRYWREIVASRPHGYFDAPVRPLLECLCTSYWIADTLWGEIHKLDPEDPKQLARWRRLLIMANRQAALHCSLAAKLKLLPRAEPGSMPQMARTPSRDGAMRF
jgi:hypothetical protein